MPQILVLSHKALALVISTGRLMTIMKLLTLKMHRVFKLVTVVKEPRKGLQTSSLFNCTATKQQDGTNVLSKFQIYREYPLQENSPGYPGPIINLHSKPDSDFSGIWSPDHTGLIHIAYTELPPN